MGHHIEVLIAKFDLLQAEAKRFLATPIASIPQRLGVLTVERESIDPSGVDEEMVFEDWPLPCRLVAFAKEISLRTPVAYVATEYHGGVGSQRAVVWEAGDVIFGPACDDTDFSRIRTWPINAALRLIGVKRRWFRDEFDSINLGNYRENEAFHGGS